MSKYSGTQFTLFLVDGHNLIASLSEAVSMGKESISQQTNAFGATSEEHTPLNLEKGSLSVGGGFFDDAADTLFTDPALVRGQNRTICAGIEGNTIGKHFIGYEGAYDQKYEVQDQKDGLTKANLSILVSGSVDEGVIVQSLTAFTADQTPPTGDTPVDYTLDPVQRPMGIGTASKAAACVIVMKSENGSPIAHGLTNGQKIFISNNTLAGPAINGEQTVTVISTTSFSIAVNTTGSTGTGSDGSFVLASTVAGGIGYVQATAFSGFTGVIPSIMHSADDTTYASLIAFTNLTDIGKERKTVTGTIDRYLSSNIDVTGAGSITVFMGFCRN